jgi:hypothetical protein
MTRKKRSCIYFCFVEKGAETLKFFIAILIVSPLSFLLSLNCHTCCPSIVILVIISLTLSSLRLCHLVSVISFPSNISLLVQKFIIHCYSVFLTRMDLSCRCFLFEYD